MAITLYKRLYVCTYIYAIYIFVQHFKKEKKSLYYFYFVLYCFYILKKRLWFTYLFVKGENLNVLFVAYSNLWHGYVTSLSVFCIYFINMIFKEQYCRQPLPVLFF